MLADRLSELGAELRAALADVLAEVPEGAHGPQRLGAALGLDKVFSHRLLKTVRAEEALAVLQYAPGPEPLRRFLRAARRRGVTQAKVTRGMTAVDRFQTALREEVGDRSRLDALLAAWLPQARAEFELRRKQAVYKAQSELQGASVAVNSATVLLHPSASGERIDVVWLVGLLGLQRLRPGARAKLTTRRFVAGADGRHPTTLAGERVEDLAGLRLDPFCAAEPAELEVRRFGEVVHYLLAGERFGRAATSDLLLAEVNREEMPRTPAPGRRPYVFAEVSTPARLLVFDVLVHRDLYPGATPELGSYDTAFDGVVDVNDEARALDRLETADTLAVLARSPEDAFQPAPEIPRHAEMLTHVFTSLDWDAAAFRGWRARVDYPLYGTQITVSFDLR